MSGLFPKCADRSVLCLRGAWPNTGANYRLSRAHNAALNVGLADFGFIFDLVFTTAPTGNVFVIKEAGAPLGYMIYTGVNGANYYIGVQMRTAAGLAIGHAGLWLPWKGRHVVTCFVDRDGNAYGRDNENIGIQIGIDPLTNVNQDNVGAFNLFSNDNTSTPQGFGPSVLSFQFYRFSSDGPSQAQIDQIQHEMMANPYSKPPTLVARPSHATELKMYLPFKDLDPTSILITDESAYVLSPTIVSGSGLTVASAIKEFMCP